MALTYPEVGATADPVLPAGYTHVRRRVRIGSGREAFDVVAADLLSWQIHRAAGIWISDITPGVDLGVEVKLGVGVGLARIVAPCLVVAVVDEPDRRGFAYGTLPRHPESGEERFLVEFDPADGSVWASIVAFSRPTRIYARLGGPASSLAQRYVTGRYLAAFAASASRSGTSATG